MGDFLADHAAAEQAGVVGGGAFLVHVGVEQFPWAAAVFPAAGSVHAGAGVAGVSEPAGGNGLESAHGGVDAGDDAGDYSVFPGAEDVHSGDRDDGVEIGVAAQGCTISRSAPVGDWMLGARIFDREIQGLSFPGSLVSIPLSSIVGKAIRSSTLKCSVGLA